MSTETAVESTATDLQQVEPKEPVFSKKNRRLITDPFNDNNPITVQVLGVCSALAVTTQLKPAFVMAISVTVVVGVSNLVISLIRNSIPSRIRNGLHRFVDPEDGLSYIYSNLEPYSAHRVFPCFDQPDIKGTYKLSVTAPRHWAVVSADAVVAASPIGGERKVHDFPRTQRFATYLFSLIAGSWVHVESSHRRLPLALYGRATMRRELERSADEIFEVTAQGLDYYADLFGRPYPFEKYDQLFVPEFNAGAMENVGAVTFHDNYLFRDPPTHTQRLIRAEVVLHELAHMWFGDLVTMRWWDDLWLNETFATYLSYRCLADATRFTEAWQVFNGQLRPAA
jgi:aminopeptidase N